jgi:hypothetical protein
MEIAIIGSLVGLGYYLNKDGLERNEFQNNNIQDFLKEHEKKINGTNIYNSNDTMDIRKKEQEMANKLYKQSQDTKDTNVLISGPPAAFINNEKHTHEKIDLPIEFKDEYVPMKKKNIKHTDINDISFYRSSDEMKGGWNDATNENQKFSNLTGSVVENYHNNMVPFFGSRITQNTNAEATSTIVDTMSGTDKVYKEKCEIPVMFAPTTNITNPYGAQSLDSQEYDRYVVGNIRTNESPIEKTRVGPGLNKGYTAEPSGGFQQSDKRDYLLPKTTNELRVKTNPKLSFNGRIVSGKKISRTGKIGVVEKNRPDSFAVWSPDRLFTTVGDCVGPRQRGKMPLKDGNRKTTVLKKRIGPAGPATYKAKQAPIGKTAPSFKQLLESFGFRNLFKEDSNKDDNKQGVNLRPVNKCNNSSKYPSQGNVGNHDGTYFKNRQGPRFTKKTNVIGNSRWASNIQRPRNRHKVYNPNDVAKTTIKETNIHDSAKLNMKPDKAPNTQVKDPNDVAKVTIRETTNVLDHVNNPKLNKETGYISKKDNMEAPVTHRQTTTTDYTGDAKGEESGGYKIVEADPKNTVRQFTSDYEYEGIAGPATDTKPLSYEDIYNSTIRSVRQDVSKGRIPATQGPKNALSGADMNVSMNKNTEHNNKAVEERGVIGTKIYNLTSNLPTCSKTVDKNTLPNQDRLDPGMVDAFKENPYTQSLHSYAFP